MVLMYVRLLTIVASALLGCRRRSTMRTLLIAAIWLAFLWFASLFTVAYFADNDHEFGAWWA